MCWTYYGSKKLLAEYYPKPKFDKVIEPFAGAAAYSLEHWQHDVTLCDKYEVITKVWKWLQQCSPADIKRFPKVEKGDVVDRSQFDCDEAMWLMGFMLQTASATPGKTLTEFSADAIERRVKYVIECLPKIKHWKIIEGVYYNLPNEEATWFIDPPYQYGGEHYVCSNKVIDYRYLAKWCKSRNGHIIVCENTRANWLSFKPLRKLQGAVKKTVEAIWSNHKMAYDNVQLGINFGDQQD